MWEDQEVVAEAAVPAVGEAVAREAGDFPAAVVVAALPEEDHPAAGAVLLAAVLQEVAVLAGAEAAHREEEAAEAAFSAVDFGGEARITDRIRLLQDPGVFLGAGIPANL